MTKYCVQVGYVDGEPRYMRRDSCFVSFNVDFEHCTLFDTFDECKDAIDIFTKLNYFQSQVANNILTGFVVIQSVDIKLGSPIMAKNCKENTKMTNDCKENTEEVIHD